MANTLGYQGAVGNTVADPGVNYKKQFEETLKNDLRFEDCGESRPLPLNSGTEVMWTRPTKLITVGTIPTAASYLLTENTVPSETTGGTTQITAIPRDYGDWMKISSRVDLMSINPVMEGFVEELKDEAAAIHSAIITTALSGNVTNQFAGGAGNEGAVADTSVLTAGELRKAMFTLRKAGVPGFEGNDYKAVIAWESAYDLMSETSTGGWLDVNKYTSADKMMRGEIGKLYGIRIIPAHNTGTGSGATATTYHSYVFGRKAFGIVALGGRSTEFITKKPGPSDTSNPLNQFSTVAWKMTTTAKVIEAARAVQIYSGTAAS